MKDLDILLSKIDYNDFKNFINSISVVASFGKVADSNSLLKTLYNVFFNKNYNDKNRFYININKMASPKKPLSLMQKYIAFQKLASLGFNVQEDLKNIGKTLIDTCDKVSAPTTYTTAYLDNYGLCAKAGNDYFLCNPLTEKPLSLKIKATKVENDKDALFEGKVQPFEDNQDLTIGENTDAGEPNPQSLTDQPNIPVKVDFEGNPVTENATDGGTEETLPLERNVQGSLTFVEKDGLYDVVNEKGATIKKGLKLTAALKLIALTEEDKVELKDQKELENTSVSVDERGAKEKNDHKDLQEVNVTTGVETKVKETEDRADHFSSVDFFDMFRKLDDKEANEVLEDIREKVSGEAGAEAYNFLLKAKENGWDFSKTYKQTADGQSESDFESERKEQSKKLARTIEKLIEEDAELSQKLNYKDYKIKKENKTASLKKKADMIDDLTFEADMSDIQIEMGYGFSYDNKEIFAKLKEKYPQLANALEPEIYETTGYGTIKWGLDIEARNWGLHTLKLRAFPAKITLRFDIHYFENEQDKENSDDTSGYFELDFNLTDVDIESEFNLGSNNDLFVHKIEINGFDSATLYA